VNSSIPEGIGDEARWQFASGYLTPIIIDLYPARQVDPVLIAILDNKVVSTPGLRLNGTDLRVKSRAYWGEKRSGRRLKRLADNVMENRMKYAITNTLSSCVEIAHRWPMSHS